MPTIQPRTCLLAGLSMLALVIPPGCGPGGGGGSGYSVTVTTSGSGSVALSPPGGPYAYGDTVKLTATPAGGWKFDRWEGGATGTTNPIQITVTSNVTVKAIFTSSATPKALEAYNLTVTVEQNNPVLIQLVGHSPDNRTLTYKATVPSKGNITVVGDNVTYTPNYGYLGPDQFTYTVSDNGTESGPGKVNITVISPAVDGWARTFGSTQDDQVAAMAIDGVGNRYVVGTFSGTVDFDPSPKNYLVTSAGKADAFVSKFSFDGSHVWTRAIGGVQDDRATGVITDAANSNVYVTGIFAGTIVVDAKSGTSLTSPSGTGGFVARFAADNTFGWARAFAGSGSASARAITLGSFGDVYVGGSFSGRIDFNNTPAGKDEITSRGQLDGFVTKLAAAGDYRWTRVFAGLADDEVMGVGGDNAGNVIATGYFLGSIDLDPATDVSDTYTSKGGTDFFILKLNTNGQKVWAHTIGGPGNDQPTGLAVNGLGDVLVGGFFERTVAFNASNLALASDQLTAVGDRDGFVTEYNSVGSYSWTRTFGGPGRDSVNAVAFGPAGEVYAAGQFVGTVNFNSGGTDTRTSAGSSDAFLTRLTSAGGYGLTVTAGGNGEDAAHAAVVNPTTTHVVWGGAFQNTADLDPRAGTEDHVSFGGNDGFTIKMTSGGEW